MLDHIPEPLFNFAARAAKASPAAAAAAAVAAAAAESQPEQSEEDEERAAERQNWSREREVAEQLVEALIEEWRAPMCVHVPPVQYGIWFVRDRLARAQL